MRLRGLLQPDRPQGVRRLHGLWRAQALASARQRGLMRQEMRASFGADDVDEAWRVAWRVHLEELLLGRLTAETVGHYIQIEGSLPTDRGVVLVYPHAGNVMLMIAALAFAGHRYVQFAARGLAPPEVAAANPETFGHNRWREAVRTVREADEDRVPAEYVTHPRGLVRALKAGAVVGIAYDGRLGSRFEPVPYLGRTALLSTGPWKLARKTGAALVPAFNLCPPDGPNRLLLGPAVQGRDEALDWLQARLREHPGHYGLWLTHCRERRAVDDHPLFVDYAPDDRWRRWASES